MCDSELVVLLFAFPDSDGVLITLIIILKSGLVFLLLEAVKKINQTRYRISLQFFQRRF